MDKRRRAHRVPPPLSYGPETVEGEPILDEVLGDAGLLLWKTARSVRLWAGLPVDERGRAFSADAYRHRRQLLKNTPVPEAVRAELKRAALILGGEPVVEAEIATACRRVAEWAEQQGMLGTAVAFAQAAALTLPEDAAMAREVALLTRKTGEFARAETWFRQAITVARQTRNGPVFIRSYLGLGKMYVLRGNYPAARSAYLRALRGAQRRQLHELAGMAHHELAVVAVRAHRPGELGRHVRAALEAYGPGHELLAALSHDVAIFWMKEGYFVEAMRVFETISPEFGAPLDRLIRAAALVRASGAAGDRARYAAGMREATRLLRHPAASEGVATALLNMARGAESAGDLDRATELAERSRQAASARGESEIVLAAEAVADSVKGGRRASEVVREQGKRAPRAVARLADDLAEAMDAGVAAV